MAESTPAVFPLDLTIDNVGDLPRITIDQTRMGGEVRTYRFAPAAVAMLVDALCGVAEASPGETRIVIKMRTADLAAALLTPKATP